MPRAIKPSDFVHYRMLSEPSFSPDAKRLAISVRKANLDEDIYESDIYIVTASGSSCVRFTAGGRDSDPVWSPDGSTIVFTSKRNFGKEEKGNALYTISAAGGEAQLLFRSEDGAENPVWSPDSRWVFYLSSVGEAEKDDVKVIRRWGFWFNGVGFNYNKRKHIFSVEAKGGKPKQVTKGDFTVNDMALSHDGTRLAYLAVANDLKPYIVDLYVHDLRSGSTTKVTSSNMEVSAVAWSPDDRQLAMIANDFTSGFASHSKLWVTTLNPVKIRKIDNVDRNKENGLNTDARAKAHGPHKLVWDEDGIFYVQAEGPSARLYKMKPGKKPELLFGGDASLEGYDVVKGKVAVVSMDASHLEELSLAGKKAKPLTTFNKEVYSELDVVAPRPCPFNASDGVPVEQWVMLPKGEGKFPAVLYVHGGPKTAFGHAYMHEFQAFVGAGYAVVFMNPRGSDGYTEKFADIRGKYGTRDFQDLMEGLDAAIKAFPQIDGDRVAIAGGSYGGYMTNWAVGHTDRFKAGVADRSIASWVSMWGTSDIGPYFTEDQIGGDPWKSEQKLLEDSPLRYVAKVKTPLLLVHSMDDYRCWMVEALQFFTALKMHGSEVEMVLFPGENHDLSRVGKPKHRVARLEHYVRWFDSHLKTPSPPPTSSPALPSAKAAPKSAAPAQEPRART